VAQLAKLTVLIRIRAGSFVGGFGGLSPGLARHWKFWQLHILRRALYSL